MRVEIEFFDNGTGTIIESKPVRDALHGLMELEDVAKRLNLSTSHAGYLRDGDETLYLLHFLERGVSRIDKL
jgi:hypothetical protein